MIHESYYWRKELVKLAQKLIKRIPYKRFWTDTQNGAFEKEIMIGFYIIRKLIEAYKLPNRIVATKIAGYKYPNKGVNVHLMNNHRFYDHYDFENGRKEKFPLKFLSNQIIHSYIFSPNFELDETNGKLRLSTIHFCSDDDRNTWIYELPITTVISLFEKIANANVTSGHYTYNPDKKDYIVELEDEIIPIPDEIEKIITAIESKS